MEVAAQHQSDLVNAIRFAMRATKDYGSVDTSANRRYVRRMGEELGHAFAVTMKASSPVNLTEKLVAFWTRNGLGDMRLVRDEPLLLEMRNCYDCTRWRSGAGKPQCAFKEGFLRRVYEETLVRTFDVEEVDCCGASGATCTFSVKPKSR